MTLLFLFLHMSNLNMNLKDISTRLMITKLMHLVTNILTSQTNSGWPPFLTHFTPTLTAVFRDLSSPISLLF